MSITLIPFKDLLLDDKISFMTRSPRQTVARITKSIEQDGLLNPLIVRRHNKKFVVLDGKKRFLALRALTKSGLFHRSNRKVPCVISSTQEANMEFDRPALLSSSELAHRIITEMNKNVSPVMVAQRFECSVSVVEDALSLTQLHPEVLKCFNNDVISLKQAAAFSTISNRNAQWSLLLQLGPFVSNSEIITAIKSGDVVLNLPDGNVVILPSRGTPHVQPRHGIVAAKSNVLRIAA